MGRQEYNNSNTNLPLYYPFLLLEYCLNTIVTTPITEVTGIYQNSGEIVIPIS